MTLRSCGAVVLLAAACASGPGAPPAAPSAVALPRSASLGPDLQPGWQVPAAAHEGERNRCIDRELAARRLDEWGNPEGTQYPGGAPELSVTARGRDRHEEVLRRRPDIAVRCSRAPGEPER